MSYKAIAAITGLSVSNVGYLLHTAVRTLRERMGRERMTIDGMTSMGASNQ